MRRTTRAKALLSLALLLALGPVVPARAQSDARGALASLPDSQVVLFVNARRIVNDLLPRVMPAADYRKLIGDAQKGGFDLRQLDYAAVAIRFADPAPAGGLPEFLVVVRGDFNADALLMLARLAAGSQNLKSRQETYGSKTLDIFETERVARAVSGADGIGSPEGGKSRSNPYPEVALTTLDSRTLVAGVPAYVKAAIDASGGRGRLSAPTLDLAAREPQALWSLTAVLPPTLADYVHKFGVPPNEELDKTLAWLKQFSLSQGMDALDLTFRAALLTDQPEHASALSGLARMGLVALQTELAGEAAKKNNKDAADARRALSVLKTVVNRTEGSTLIISAAVPVSTVAELVRKQSAKQQTARHRTARRRGRRRPTRRH
ncbi:MAG TPA: hypothetical protein VE713_13070 [Pyrinomonadaceae bacterium]|jgi:hypothetical protein|nr:hypothetical protein [Pyrinomonadaceae bacterium]